tara:strand:- start:3759 stop:4847 length:1089 start_codon:yes stop_codon:yes gene_type:complete
MPQTYVELRDNVEAILQDGGISPAGTASNQTFATAELDLVISDALRDIASIVPNVAKVSYSIESRFGQVSSTSASNLVDTTKGQFTSGDVGKVVYNATQKTWADIISFSNTAQVGLSKDIMSGANDAYKIFNKDCRNDKQINISDITDYIEVLEAEYPLGTKRQIVPVSSNPDIIELDMMRSVPDSKALSAGVQPDTEVLVSLNKRHKVSKLTDLSGIVKTAALVAATSLAMSSLAGSETIESDQEFTIAGVRGIYWTTADTTLSSNTATVSIYPPLESAAASALVITLRQSTLTPKIEGPVAQYIAGYAALSKRRHYIDRVNTGSRPAADIRDWARELLGKAISDLRQVQGVRVSTAYSRK